MPSASVTRQIQAAKRTVKKPTVPGTFAQRAEAEVVRLLLPVPVSEAGWRLTMQRPGRVSGRYALTLRMPEESGLDLDNAIKATSDLLQLHGVVRNDRLASRIVLEWQSEQPVAMVEVVPFVGAA
jgi:hypothetical protein